MNDLPPQPLSKTARRVGLGGVIVAVVMGILGVFAAEPRSETVILARDIAPLRAGVEMEFFTDQKIHFVDTYTMRVIIDDVEHNTLRQPVGVKFRWEAFGATKHRNFNEKGEVEATDLLRSRSLNCSWLSGQKIVSQDTFAWLSREICEEVIQRGEARFSVDTSVSAGRPLRFHRVRSVLHPVMAQGREASLRGIELRSERGDHMVMLEDCGNPLVLEAQIMGLSSWRLDSVQLRGTPAAVVR